MGANRPDLQWTDSDGKRHYWEIDPNDTKGLKGRDDRDSVHWKGGSHIHVGGQDHIPVNK